MSRNRRAECLTFPLNLNLPFLLPSQAQKHVTVNTCLGRLDTLAHLAVVSITELPPPFPGDGVRHIVPAEAGDVFASHDGELGVFADGVLEFVVPQPGWLAWVQDEGRRIVPAGEAGEFGLLGIITAAIPPDRLSISGDASLFSQDGSDHCLKINKQGDVGYGQYPLPGRLYMACGDWSYG